MTIPSPGRLRLRPYYGVENGAPLSIRHPPDGGAVVDAGNIAAAKRAIDLRLAGDPSHRLTWLLFCDGTYSQLQGRGNHSARAGLEAIP